MARPIKDGLDYFPKDVGFYHDRKIKTLLARFGRDGACLYDYILCEIYRDKGYYLAVDDDFLEIAAADLGIGCKKTAEILDALLKKGLLNAPLYHKHGVLASHGIQLRYQSAVEVRGAKRKIAVAHQFWLLAPRGNPGLHAAFGQRGRKNPGCPP